MAGCTIWCYVAPGFILDHQKARKTSSPFVLLVFIDAVIRGRAYCDDALRAFSIIQTSREIPQLGTWIWLPRIVAEEESYCSSEACTYVKRNACWV